ncbi:MAG: hypothetical protein KAS21_02820 [Candidatus Aminicenantes bacterium]|nr:hypothetical protein [Candidatus Aminicenantes bacterium]
MKKKLILFRSKYGSTKEYIKELAERIDGDCVISDAKKFSGNLKDYNPIILGSCTYMGRILIVDFIKENKKILKNRKIYLFVVGVFPEDNEASKQSFELIPEEIRKNLLGYRKLPGRINITKLNFFERMILKITRAKVEDLVDYSQIDLVIEDLKESGLL